MNKALTPIQQFKMQVRDETVQNSFRDFMPKDLLGKFTAVTIRAVQENPDLLTKVDRKSLFLACQHAAQDGLMPDGREGALVAYGKSVQWQPMIQGIRKKLAQAGWDIRAEIVYENDDFTYDLGDEPRITHNRAKGDRGDIIGAYAIATEKATGDKYREYMDIEELEKVRQSSRGKDSPAWKAWKTEMYRKTVAKRLRKYLPIADDSLLDLIDRDNEQYDIKSDANVTAARNVQEAVRSANSEPSDEEDGDYIDSDDYWVPDQTEPSEEQSGAEPSEADDPLAS